MKRIYLIILCSTLNLSLWAQQYQQDISVPVVENEITLDFGWAGGLNSVQYNTMDIDGDGDQDIITFDRTSDGIKVYLNEAGKRVYSIAYNHLFPSDIRSWLVLRDVNCDGKKDIFTSESRGMQVYINISDQEGLKWRAFNERDNGSFILTEAFGSSVNLQMNSSDIPSIDDIDNDGDLDILVFRFSGASTVEYHQNMSVENTGVCDSLQLERVETNWGGFEQCECSNIAFNNASCTTGGRQQHQGGKAILTIDLDNDGDKEAVISEESCPELNLLKNTGSISIPQMITRDPFPSTIDPAQLTSFPAAFYEDVDFDGKKDLLVSPNVPSNSGFNINFQFSNWYYKNIGTKQLPDFELIQKNFLQDQMIDVGENSYPTFADYDNDGDMDLFIGQLTGTNQLPASVILYENTGSRSNPAFTLNTTDFARLSESSFYNVKPDFIDLDRDGQLDLVFSASSLVEGGTNIYYFRNTGNFNFTQVPEVLFTLSVRFGGSENFKLTDINGDDLLDILVGTSTGNVEYHKNVGTTLVPTFELENQFFYDIERSPFRPFPMVEVSDLNNNGILDMIVGDARGGLVLYQDFVANLDDPKPGITDIVLVNGVPAEYNLGTRIVPRVVNIFGESRPSLVLGSAQGGLTILRDSQAIPVAAQLLIYPNPSADETITILSKRDILADLISLDGRFVKRNIELKKDTEVRLNIKSINSGLYLLRTKDGEVERVVILNR